MKGLPIALRRAIKASSKKEHKYGAVSSVCPYRHKHDSRKEAMWCIKLHQMQKEGKIRDLLCEPEYDITVNGVVVCRHSPDFDYEKLTLKGWEVEVLDVKGLKLPLWSLKHKLFKAVYPTINYVVV